MSKALLSERLIVLDTNVVLDLFHFNDPLTRPLRRALESGALRGAATEATFGEWLRVLAYPAFRLSAARQSELRAQYDSLCRRVAPPPTSGVPPEGTPIHYGLKPVWSRMPRCSDPDDQKFLDLAAGLAVPLVSKDRAVLKLKRRGGARPVIFTPADALAWLAGEV